MFELLFRRARFVDDPGTGDGTGDGGTGDGGGGNDSWQSKLPEDLRADPSLVDFKDETELVPMPVNVARSYINTKKLVGRDKIPMPKTPEEWDETYRRLGKPEAATQYNVAVEGVEDPKVAETLKPDAEWFKEIAHKHNLTDEQARGLFSEYVTKTVEGVNSQLKDAQDIITANEAELRTKYGNAFEGKLVLMNRGIDEIDRRVGGGFKDLITGVGAEKSSKFVQGMVMVGEMMAEDLGLDKNTGGPAMAAGALDDQISTLKADPAYTDGTNPGHQAAVSKMAKLMQQKHGTKPVDAMTRTSFIQ